MVLKSRDRESRRSKNVSIVSDQKHLGLASILEELEDDGSGAAAKDLGS